MMAKNLTERYQDELLKLTGSNEVSAIFLKIASQLNLHDKARLFIQMIYLENLPLLKAEISPNNYRQQLIKSYQIIAPIFAFVEKELDQSTQIYGNLSPPIHLSNTENEELKLNESSSEKKKKLMSNFDNWN